MSARVQEDAAGKLGLAFEDMGDQQLKNRRYAHGERDVQYPWVVGVLIDLIAPGVTLGVSKDCQRHAEPFLIAGIWLI